MAAKSGLLYVTMQPHESLPEAQFHDWYNNEHGPIRLRLPFVTNGFRYRATDSTEAGGFTRDTPEWMALYDITDMSNITTDAYTRLRDPNGVQSQRERDTMKKIAVNRKLYDFLYSRESPNFKKLEDLEAVGTGNVLDAVIVRLNPDADKASFEKVDNEKIEELSKEKGWLRSRRFVTSDCEGRKYDEEIEYLTIHEFAPPSSLPTEKLQTSSSVVKEQRTRSYELYYTFGPAPRDLESLSSSTTVPTSSSLDSKTKTFSTTSSESKVPVIESYVTTSDGTILPYRLEGSPNPNAPLIVLCNSILTTYNIWDGFLSHFFSNPSNASKYRVLRYNMRGRFSKSGISTTTKGEGARVTVDVLASDVTTLLNALRVPKAHCVIGVSLGGATALTLAVRHPFSSRIESFISCDTSMKSPAGNSKAWSERIAIAEKESLILPLSSPYIDLNTTPTKPPSSSPTPTAVVGENLAEVTVRRWFVPKSYDIPALVPELEKVKEMVKTNSLEGFEESVKALWEYDLVEEVGRCGVRGLFVVGEGDGVLPKSMKGMADSLGGGGAMLEIIKEAGHLPMVEKPVEFGKVVEGFLGGL